MVKYSGDDEGYIRSTDRARMVPFLFGVKLAVSYVNMAYWFTTNRRSYVATANKDDKTSLQSGIASARAGSYAKPGAKCLTA